MTTINGNEKNCPNYRSGNLDTSYITYTGLFRTEIKEHPEYGTDDFNKTCFNICATKNASATFIVNGRCSPCSTDEGAVNNPSFGTKNYLKNAGLYEMCNVPGDSNSGSRVDVGGNPTWFNRQQEANLKGVTQDRINWNSGSTRPGQGASLLPENTPGGKIQRYWTSTNKPLTNLQILRLIGNRTAGTIEYILPDKYMKRQPNQLTLDLDSDVVDEAAYDFDKLRSDINQGRGSVVYCNQETLDNWRNTPSPGATPFPNGANLASGFRSCWNASSKTYPNQYDNDAPVFGPAHIVVEEVEDFVTALLDEARDEETGDGAVAATQSLSSLLSNLSYDSAFEGCVNDVLNTGENDDFEIQDRIEKYTSIKEFTSEDIHYLKRKLRKIVNLKTRDINECMNLLNLGKSICATGIADKTLMIGSLIFQVVGNNKIDVMQADVDERQKLNRLIDELGPLIPRAVKNIIEISKEYEARVCNVPTNTTLLLERLYKDLYDKETKVTIDLIPNFDLNFNELASTTNFWFFIQKMTVLVVMSVLLFLAANFLMVFLSRTQVITKVSE
jgi:hypothetical protein